MTSWGELIYDIGEAMLQDDAADIGKFDRPHHWHYGAICMALGQVIIGIELFLESNPEVSD